MSRNRRHKFENYSSKNNFYSQMKIDFEARTEKQKELVDAIWSNDVVFALGPAGTGKSFVLISQALIALLNGGIDKIFITRPVVESGENLGFLPGDIDNKLAPYLIPIYDSVKKLVTKDVLDELIEEDKIEIAPFAYMRGRTFENAVIVADECQNADKEQIKMLLTRLGNNAKILINGDASQIDRKDRYVKPCALTEAANKLEKVKGIKIVEFSNADCQRHPIVQKMLDILD